MTLLIQTTALILLFAGAAWLTAVAALMAFRPARALQLLRKTASTHRVNLIEQGLRMMAGVALILRAPASKSSQLFEAGGWFVLLSSVMLMAVPLRWHAGYALWWADRLPYWAVRTTAPLSLLFAVLLVYLAL